MAAKEKKAAKDKTAGAPKATAKKKLPKTEVGFKEDRYEIRLSGSGGQGLITAGVILAEAIAVGDNKNAAQTQSYGPEARGGHTRCDVIVSDGDISFPEAIKLDLLLSLTQEAADVYAERLKPDCGLFIIDSDAVKRKPQRPFIEAPFTQAAIDKLGSAVATNIVSLGFICEFTGQVTKKSLEEAVVDRFPDRFAENNLKALKIGYDLAKKVLKDGHSTTCEETFETEIDRT
ncbi:MAG: 2-oxoacid:acceptor oxidoreductase family protein [bacterium]